MHACGWTPFQAVVHTPDKEDDKKKEDACVRRITVVHTSTILHLKTPEESRLINAHM